MNTTDLGACATRRAAEEYAESSSELQSAWQDKNAGKIWERIARELERAAVRIEQICNQEGEV
jgi:hypothetical protein